MAPRCQLVLCGAESRVCLQLWGPKAMLAALLQQEMGGAWGGWMHFSPPPSSGCDLLRWPLAGAWLRWCLMAEVEREPPPLPRLLPGQGEEAGDPHLLQWGLADFLLPGAWEPGCWSLERSACCLASVPTWVCRQGGDGVAQIGEHLLPLPCPPLGGRSLSLLPSFHVPGLKSPGFGVGAEA